MHDCYFGDGPDATPLGSLQLLDKVREPMLRAPFASMPKFVRASALDPLCKAWDRESLYVIDAVVFPSSAAVNPALTVAARGLRGGALPGHGAVR